MKLLIWDFDGTLGYREGGMWSASLWEVAQRVAPERGLTVDQIRPHLQAGFPWQTPERPHPDLSDPERWWEAINLTLAAALRAAGFEEGLASLAAGQVRAVYTDPARWRLFEDTRPILQSLSAQGWTHALLSNHVPELPRFLHHLGLSPLLALAHNSAQTGYEKPHPRAFQAVLEAFPEAGPVWMIGDNPVADVQGAEAVGIPGILVRRPHPDSRRYAADLAAVAAMVESPA